MKSWMLKLTDCVHGELLGWRDGYLPCLLHLERVGFFGRGRFARGLLVFGGAGFLFVSCQPGRLFFSVIWSASVRKHLSRCGYTFALGV